MLSVSYLVDRELWRIKEPRFSETACQQQLCITDSIDSLAVFRDKLSFGREQTYVCKGDHYRTAVDVAAHCVVRTPIGIDVGEKRIVN